MPADLSNWTPRPYPERRVFEGRLVRLEPLDAAKHAAGLYQSIVDDANVAQRFLYLREEPPNSLEELTLWMEEKAQMRDPLYFAIILKETGQVVGRQTFLRTDTANGVSEIGHIFWSSSLARTTAATECLYLFGEYLFEQLGYRRLEWKCDTLNEPSKRAALRFGFTFEGVFRQHLVVKGPRSRDSAWLSIIDGEWPLVGGALRRWLAVENFDAAGNQRKRLEEIREEMQ